jgi:integrase
MISGHNAMIGTEVATAAHWALKRIGQDRAEHYERASRSERTWRQYKSAWKSWERWCALNGWTALPADMNGVKLYIAWLADSGRSLATINGYLAAIASAHSIAGQPFNRTAIKDAIKGVRREKARQPRQARPLVSTDIRAVLSGFAAGAASDDRDAALLALGFACALRRAELVGLDWQQHGSGDGFVMRDDRGIVVTLLRTKGGKGELETVIVPCADMPTACAALDRWAQTARLQPGEPVFRPIDKGQHIGTERLTDRSVARIIKARVRERALAMGATEADAEALAATCSGHSLRAGYCTAAAMAGTPEWKIRRRSRHRTAELVARYVRAAEQWTDSGLKGVGF